MRQFTKYAFVTTLVSLAAVLPAKAEELVSDVMVGNILFGRPLEPGINVVWLGPDAQRDQRAAAIYREPSPEIRARAQAELTSDPALRDFIQRRDIQPQNVIAIQTAASGGKVLFVR